MKAPFATLALLALAACGTQGAGSSSTTGASSATASGAASAGGDAGTLRAARVRQGNSIARAIENDALLVADEDHETLRVLALPAQLKSKRADFRTPGRPAQVVVTGDRVLVTIRQIGAGEGALLVLRRKPDLGLEEVGRVPLPADAWGIALTPDDGTALVTSAWTHRLSAVDLGKLEVKWSVDVAREPRGVVVVQGAGGSGDKAAGLRAYVSHLVGSEVTRVDDILAKAPSVKRVELPASPLRSPSGTKLRASLGYALVASPEGDRVYFPRHALGTLGPDSWAGAGTVDVLATGSDTPLAPPRLAAPMTRRVEAVEERIAKHEAWGLDGVVSVVETRNQLRSPRAVAYRTKTRTLLVVSEGAVGVAELDARAMDPTLVPVQGYGTGRTIDPVMGVADHGEAPSGIALSEDENTAWVFCRATDDIVVLDLAPDARRWRSAPRAAIALGGDEDKEMRIGRALFYDALNDTMSGGMSCAGCHPEGRDDGHVWHEAKLTMRTEQAGGGEGREDHFTNFFAGTDLSVIRARWGDVSAEGEGGFGYARQTPIIAGRVKAKGPYGWHGESPDLAARIMAGFGLHRWINGSDNETMKRAFANHLARFIREGLVPPPRVERPLTDEEQRGKAIFASPATQCATCHPVDTEYTDRTIQPLRKIKPPQGFAEDPVASYKVPSLLYLGGSAPYMHDGRFESLETLIEYNQDRMGKTAQLTPEERAALIAFLRTL